MQNHDPNCNDDTFFDFIEKFNLNSNIVEQSKTKRKKICNDAYDRYWKNEINKQNSKSISYCKFKNTNWLEPYLSQSLLNQKHKTAISRFRLSNHSLMIEKGRHAKPKKIERNERFCQFCEKIVEDEKHFLISCPLYTPARRILERVCIDNCLHYESLNADQKFIFILSNENPVIIKHLGKFIAESMSLRERLVDYFFT